MYIIDNFKVFCYQAEKLSRECAKLKAHIKLVIGGLQELQQIGLEEPRKPQRDIFLWVAIQ